MNYHFAREFADSWGLVFLLLLFLTALWRALRPSAWAQHESARLIPLRDEEPNNG
ncbi:cbb3-type cytochrome c oxidase subunit 3 [Sphingomonas sp. ID1715]|uniref:cbb3-type cytochrome c oxidase subunit 3 n=1 Tax=Sphingomonas sp. ID1715 TaxID=1656898 RepID=UPI0014886ED7|nr:cbb3-type cytochrome c oxidase subunit 3 [Sphingomonas sp. ID1715]